MAYISLMTKMKKKAKTSPSKTRNIEVILSDEQLTHLLSDDEDARVEWIHKNVNIIIRKETSADYD